MDGGGPHPFGLEQLDLLDTRAALIITSLATKLPFWSG